MKGAKGVPMTVWEGGEERGRDHNSVKNPLVLGRRKKKKKKIRHPLPAGGKKGEGFVPRGRERKTTGGW